MAWSFEPFVVIALALSAWLYRRGARRMVNRSLRDAESFAFLAGWLTLVIALVSPLDRLGAALFSAHMTQHEVLMLIAAPLLILGRPLAPFLLALPAHWRRELTAPWKTGMARRGWRFLVSPFVAWLTHAVVLWVWHAPALFQATLESESVHAAQHLSFLVSALLFCEALIHGRERRLGYGAAVIYVFTTAVHTSALGALLTFSGLPENDRGVGIDARGRPAARRFDHVGSRRRCLPRRRVVAVRALATRIRTPLVTKRSGAGKCRSGNIGMKLARLYPILVFEKVTAGRISCERTFRQERSFVCLHCLPSCCP
jgi:hypothetical protein